MNVWQFTYYSIKEPEKFGRYYTERPEIPEDDEELMAQEQEYILFASSAFLSDFCIKNHVERTDVLPRIEKVVLKGE